jgi:hypothetical protein
MTIVALTPDQATQQVVAVLSNIINSNLDTPLADKVEDVLDKVQTALVELLKTPPDNQAAVGNIEGAVGDIEAAVKDGLLDAEEGTPLMDDLADIARYLADNALNQAIAQGGDTDLTNLAALSLIEGDQFRAAGEFKDAVNKYKDALAKAESALQ